MKYLILLLSISLTTCTLHKEITYSYGSSVNDSITNYLQKRNKDFNIQKIDIDNTFAIISEDDEGIIILLNNYKHMPISIIQLIQKTNRFILIGQKYKIPILYHMDVASSVVKNEGLPYLPYGGHYIKINHAGNIVIKEGELF